MSLVEWMTENGARHFAVASRRPSIDPKASAHLESKGANIQTLALDVSDKLALHSAYARIMSSMPPIGGVANAAMVLRDKAFGSCSWTDFDTVLRPKVDGSANLDEVFSTQDLEFFVLFSSMASFIGNPGQSNYGAANMFMASLAANRRNRGLAGSVIHIGLLQGLGHFSRSLDTGSNAESQLQNRFNVTSLSETDLHFMFAHAVLSGRPDAQSDPGLLMGLDTNTRHANQENRLRRVPLFSHCFHDNDVSRRDDHLDVQGSQQSIESLLANAADHREALAALEQAFTAKLGTMLQASTDNISGDTPLVAMGIDSLVAVEIRSWFLKEISVDMAILKILGGATLAEVCRDALAKFSGFKFATNNSDTSVQTGPVSFSDSPDTTDTASVELTPSVSSAEETETSPIRGDIQVAGTEAQSCTIGPEDTLGRSGPMSYSQARLFFLYEFLEDKSTYNAGYSGKYRGELDFGKLRRALYEVGMNCQSLRSSYAIDGNTGQPVQIISDQPQIHFEHRLDCSKSDVVREIHRQRSLDFDIEHGKVMRVIVLSCSRDLHYLVFAFHYIALDLVSWLVFLKTLHLVYSGRTLEKPP